MSCGPQGLGGGGRELAVVRFPQGFGFWHGAGWGRTQWEVGPDLVGQVAGRTLNLARVDLGSCGVGEPGLRNARKPAGPARRMGRSQQVLTWGAWGLHILPGRLVLCRP